MSMRARSAVNRVSWHTKARTRLVRSVFVLACVSGFVGPAYGAGRYFKVDYPASTVPDELRIAVTYTLWIPDGAKTLRGIIVHQHGAGMTASKEGSTAAYDLHWQALAKKWDCALLGPCYHVLSEGDLGPAGSEYWFDPRRGSDKTFVKALGEFADKAGHPELATVPWALWGHSAGGIWSDVMVTLHPERIIAVYFRSGSTVVFRDRPVEFPRPQVPAAAYTIPMMCSPGVKEKTITSVMLTTFREYRAEGAPIGYAQDPRTGHECGDSRYLAIPFLDACLAMRLPDKGSQDPTLKPVDMGQAWLAPLTGNEALPAAEFKGNTAESVWLPNEAVARAWMDYVKTGAVDDSTPPPAPSTIRVTDKGDQGTEIVWDAEADFESGICNFIVLREGQELASVPEKPVGKFGRPLFQSMTYHDTPDQPMPEMRYLDATGKAGEKHSYSVITVNSVGLKSPASYPRINLSTWYQVDPAWPQRPGNIQWGAMSGVAVDAEDHVWVLSRAQPAVQVYQPDGKFLLSWGQGQIGTAHQIKFDSQGNVWVVDVGSQVILQFTPQGKLLRTLGTPGQAGCDERHFNKPTDVVITPGGEIFVSDGYGNGRVVHFDKDGKFVKAWGKLGTGPGELSLPHAIALDSQGRLYVADRNNARIQVFAQDGTLLDQWRDILVPCGLWMAKNDELWACGSSPMP